MKEKNRDQIIGAFVITIIGLIISIVLQFQCEIPFYFTGTLLILIDLLYLIVIVIYFGIKKIKSLFFSLFV